MARNLSLTVAAFLTAFFLSLRLIVTEGAAVIVSEHLAAPVQVMPAP